MLAPHRFENNSTEAIFHGEVERAQYCFVNQFVAKLNVMLHFKFIFPTNKNESYGASGSFMELPKENLLMGSYLRKSFMYSLQYLSWVPCCRAMVYKQLFEHWFTQTLKSNYFIVFVTPFPPPSAYFVQLKLVYAINWHGSKLWLLWTF